ncbi:MAG: hypothetical protein ACRD12_11820, partial [Acidimicrobiales bacterium]
HGRGHGMLLLGRNERAHHGDELVGEERVEGKVVDRSVFAGDDLPRNGVSSKKCRRPVDGW